MNNEFYEGLLHDVLQDGRNTISIKNKQRIGLHHFVTNADIITHLRIHLGTVEFVTPYRRFDGDGNGYLTYTQEL